MKYEKIKEEIQQVVLKNQISKELLEFPQNNHILKSFDDTYGAHGYGIVHESLCKNIMTNLCGIWDNTGDYTILKLFKIFDADKRSTFISFWTESHGLTNHSNAKNEIKKIEKKIISITTEFKNPDGRLLKVKTHNNKNNHKIELTKKEREIEKKIDNVKYHELFSLMDDTRELFDQLIFMIECVSQSTEDYKSYAKTIAEEFWNINFDSSPEN